MNQVGDIEVVVSAVEHVVAVAAHAVDVLGLVAGAAVTVAQHDVA